jgi:thymidylate kinase
MLIILEGVDGAGKSTFINELSSMLPDQTKILHRAQLKRHPMQEYVGDIASYHPGRDVIICDRWHVGELVYGPLYRGASQLTGPQALFIEKWLQSRGALKLHMNTDYETVKSRLADRGEDFLQEHHVRLVYDFYEAYCEENHWLKVYDFSPQTIISIAERYAKAALPLRDFPAYVGPPMPSGLIVAPPGMPVYPEPRNSTHALYAALHVEGAGQELGIVPADHRTKQLWESLHEPPTVVLGTETEYLAHLPRARKILTTPHAVLTMGRDDAIVNYGRFITEELSRA